MTKIPLPFYLTTPHFLSFSALSFPFIQMSLSVLSLFINYDFWYLKSLYLLNRCFFGLGSLEYFVRFIFIFKTRSMKHTSTPTSTLQRPLQRFISRHIDAHFNALILQRPLQHFNTSTPTSTPTSTLHFNATSTPTSTLQRPLQHFNAWKHASTPGSTRRSSLMLSEGSFVS